MRIKLDPGILVAIEGIDGAGKTTQARRLASRLNRAGFGAVLTKEPTDGPWGRKIRASASTGRMSPDEELNAFIEDRRQHVAELIKPSLTAGKVVIVDRYYFSTVAYQGARGFRPEALLAANEAFAPPPDVLFILEVEPRVGLQRVRKRGDEANLFEREDLLAKSAAIFDGIDRDFLVRLDARVGIDDVERKVVEAIVEGPLRRRLCREDDVVACRTQCGAPDRCDFVAVARAFAEASSLPPPVD